MKKVKSIFLGLVWIFAGLCSIGIGNLDIEKGKESNAWQKVEAEIVSAEPEFRRGSRTKTGGTRSKYIIEPSYTYRVDGEIFKNDMVGFGRTDYVFYEEAEASAFAYRLKNEQFYVYYNPQNPSEAVIEKGPHSTPYVMIWAGAALIITGLVFIIKPFVRRQKQTEKELSENEADSTK